MIRAKSKHFAKTISFVLPSTMTTEYGSEITRKLNELTQEIKFESVQCHNNFQTTFSEILKANKESGEIQILSGEVCSEAIENSSMFHSALTKPLLLKESMSPDYQGNFPQGLDQHAKLCSVRAITPAPYGMKIRPKDRLDIFPAQGIDSSKEGTLMEESFKKTADTVNELVKVNKIKKVFIVKKHLSRISNLNKLYEDSMMQYIHTPEGVELQVISSTSAYNRMTMFPEKNEAIFVLNDISTSLTFEQILAGIAGGKEVNFAEFKGETEEKLKFTLYNAPTKNSNPMGILLAAARIIQSEGCVTEGRKLCTALKKILKSVKGNLTDNVSKETLRNYLKSI